MLGVDIESVWQQGSLITTPPTGPKKSKYTVPVENSPHDNNNASYQNRAPPQQSDYYRPDFGPIREDFSGTNRGYENDFIPISQPQSPPSSQAPPQYQNPEIPILKEALTQQSGAVSECQKELYYLKAIINQLEKKLYEAKNRVVASKQTSSSSSSSSWHGFLWMLLIILILIIVLVILAQLSQKVNKLLKQPLITYD